MLELAIMGRGGQGAQTAGILLARAFYAEQNYVQSFASYGGARRGTPVSAMVRVDESPIRLRCNVERPDAILYFDDSLLNEPLLKSADSQTKIVVNSRGSHETLAAHDAYDITRIDGFTIAEKNGMGMIINSALLGAFVGIVGRVSIETVIKVIEESAPVKKPENVASCLEAYEQTQAGSPGAVS
jgi:pyruvate ferredoxin oxidoreductase gamma subunit